MSIGIATTYIPHFSHKRITISTQNYLFAKKTQMQTDTLFSGRKTATHPCSSGQKTKSPSVAVPPSAAVWSMPLCRVLWFVLNKLLSQKKTSRRYVRWLSVQSAFLKKSCGSAWVWKERGAPKPPRKKRARNSRALAKRSPCRGPVAFFGREPGVSGTPHD